MHNKYIQWVPTTTVGGLQAWEWWLGGLCFTVFDVEALLIILQQGTSVALWLALSSV